MTDHLNVQGGILAGDGSGGLPVTNPRLRKCDCGLVAITPTDDFNFQYLGHACRSVPGKQTVPRAETTSVLHALKPIRGNAILVCDNWFVVSAFKKGDGYKPSGNGFFRQAWIVAMKDVLP